MKVFYKSLAYPCIRDEEMKMKYLKITWLHGENGKQWDDMGDLCKSGVTADGSTDGLDSKRRQAAIGSVSSKKKMEPIAACLCLESNLSVD